MSMGEQSEQTAPPAAGAPRPEELTLDLDLAPAWARRMPDENRYAGHSGEDRASARRGEHRGPRRADQARPGAGRRPDGERRRREERGGSREDRGRREGRGRRPDDDERPREAPGRHPRGVETPEAPPLGITFHPDQKQLVGLLRQLRASAKAYPLVGLAGLLTSKPEFCSVKLEPRGEGEDAHLYQCKTCRAVARDRSALAAHAVREHLPAHFDVVESEEEAPAGHFVCVARCGLSGALLGPPNHHSYAERLQELHRTRFSGLSLEEYRAKIEMCHDAALIEQWRQEARKKTVYRLKAGTPADREPKPWAAAEAYFVRHCLQPLIQRTARAVLPVSQALSADDRRLRLAVAQAWQREAQAPRSMIFSLRAAIRNRQLCLFRMEGRGGEYVSAVAPAPLGTAHAVDAVRRIVAFVKKHAGCKRPDLLRELLAGRGAESSEASQLLSHITWLVGKGHLIELFDGTLRPSDATSVSGAWRAEPAGRPGAPAEIEPADGPAVSPPVPGSPGSSGR